MLAPAKRSPKPKRPTNLPHGRWLGDFEPLSEVERQLVEHCARGERLTLGNERPEKPLAGNKIRADIIRFLLLGGDDHNPVHESGVMVEGAWIENVLNLRQVCCRARLVASACRFAEKVIAVEAKIPALHLARSSIPGLEADGITVERRILLRGTLANGEVRLLGAEVGRDLSCGGAILSNKEGKALNADRIRIMGGVFLIDEFTAIGEVRMLGAEIGGDLTCSGGTFSNEKGNALRLDGANVRNGLLLRGGTFAGKIDLSAAFAATLVDDQRCYENATLLLNGFRYERIVGPTAPGLRIGWLKRQRQAHLSDDFKPQPWEQLIRVLRDMGHPAEAAQIAMAKQRALRGARQIGLRQPNPAFSGWRLGLDKGWSAFSNFLARRLHWFYGWIAGYGHRPARIVWRMALVCALASLAYYGGREYGLIGPRAPMIQLHSELARCGTGGDAGAIHWTSPDCPMPPEYSTFQPFFYSLDVILPFVDLHQEADWRPVVINEEGRTLWGGRALRWLMWFEIIFGWIASVMFVGIISRLVDKD